MDHPINHSPKAIQKARQIKSAIDPLFLSRWSPRAFSEEPIEDADFQAIVEAGVSAPSSFNAKPTAIIYAKRGSSDWDNLFSLLLEGNQSWVKRAPLLALIISKKTNEQNKPLRTHSFDSGSFLFGMLLEGSKRGCYGHPMSGFDYEKARELFPPNWTAEAMVCFGKLGSSHLLEEPLIKKEEAIATRPSYENFLFEGKMI